MQENFQGEALSWDVADGIVELALHRPPANEIGSLTLKELEGFAEALVALYAEDANAFTEADQRLVEAAGRLLSEHVPLATHFTLPVLSVS